MELPRCPITLDVMRDPVMDCNGHTFERSAIEAWYHTHDTSPVTGALVINKSLTPNYAIKQLLEATVIPPTPAIGAASSAGAVASAGVARYVSKLPAITSTARIYKWQDKQYLNINIAPQPVTEFKRQPVTCIAVIDVSGSMGERATPYNPAGENDNFSRLDLVKHSLNTVYKSLSPEIGDKLAIISFNASATLVLSSTQVNISNNERINASISTLRAGGNTNIWAGLQMALQLADSLDKKTQNIHILLLTDGASNYNPPRGLLPTFDSIYKLGSYPIHTFAYGYEVDSPVVASIATKSTGIFGYIPDGTMVGTIFINAMSNILAMVYNNVTLELIYKNSSSNHTVYLGAILACQARNLTLEYKSSNPLEYINIYYDDVYSITRGNTISYETDSILIANRMAIYDIINIINGIISVSSWNAEMQKSITRLMELYTPFNTHSAFISDLLIDCNSPDANKGQIAKSIEKASWFNKWGAHYLRSLNRAYQLEMCLNFKDLAPQHLCGEEFKRQQARIEVIFNDITPPVPSIQNEYQVGYQPGYGVNSNHTSTVTSYASIPQSYYDVSGGCFTGNWSVLLPNGSTKPVSSILSGDIVVSNDSPTGTAKVVCVLKLAIARTMCMISLDGVNGITAYHPLWISSLDSQSVQSKHDWVFPESLTDEFIIARTGDYMYDFVIDSGYSVCLITNINIQKQLPFYNVACLGHGCSDNSVIDHKYFGSHRVIDDLKDHEGWATGLITLNEWDFQRDETGRIVKLEF